MAIAATACGDSTSANNSASEPTLIQLQSDPGDPLGSGGTYSYTQANSIIDVGAFNGQFSITIHGNEFWSGQFSGTSTANLQPGTYSNMSWWSVSGCNTTGSFTIDSVSYDSTALKTIDLHFEQRCGGAAGALHGTIHWSADDKTHPPGPIDPVPPNLWKPDATPVGTNYVYLQSDTGDYIGGGGTYLYTPGNASMGFSGGGLEFDVSVTTAPQSWNGGVRAMAWINRLALGYYPQIGPNPTRGALGWSSDSRGCNAVTGWFAVDHLTYVADTVTAVDLRFEQHCDGDTAALHGAVHWVR